MSAVRLAGVRKSYGRDEVLHGIDLTIDNDKITAVLGPSGSGKTTLLRLIAGFERVDAGTITIAGRVVDDQRTRLRPERRGIGYVAQDGGLFPHLTAARNISFGIGRRQRATVDELLELVGLTGLGHRYPHELSGGQQQRVALARALAIKPALILLDEPFSSLDAGLRTSLRRDVARALADTKTPAVIVTHDQDEALSLAQQVVVIDQGSILGLGSPSKLYRIPDSATVARYLGEANLLSARVAAGTAGCALGEFVLSNAGVVADGPATILLRPEQVQLVSGDAGVWGTITGLDYFGHDSLLSVELSDHSAVTVRISGESPRRRGDRVGVRASGEVVAFGAQKD